MKFFIVTKKIFGHTHNQPNLTSELSYLYPSVQALPLTQNKIMFANHFYDNCGILLLAINALLAIVTGQTGIV